MKILTTYKGGRLTLFLKGELDHHEARDVMKKAERYMEEYMPRVCIINMSGLTFMDSSGIAVILKISKRMTATEGKTIVENPSRQASRVIEASGIGKMVRVTASGEA